MHKISQDLAIMTKADSWEPIGDFRESEITQRRYDAAVELRNSPVGRELRARGGTDVFDAVLAEFANRVRPPSVSPFFETLVQAARDVLVTLPAESEASAESLPAVPSPEEEQSRKDTLAAQDAARDQRFKCLTKFAHMVNAAIEFGGVKCLKPIVGVVTLKFAQDGKEYKYEYSGIKLDEFRNEFEEACAKGLIR